MSLSKEVWLPYVKFFMLTIALNYPTHPNDVSKKNKVCQWLTYLQRYTDLKIRILCYY